MNRSDAMSARRRVSEAATRDSGALRASRRGFLGLAGTAAAMAALAQLRAVPPASAAPVRDPGPRFFDDAETAILRQVMERVVDTGLAEAPRVADTRAVEALDILCAQLDPELSRPLPLLLRAFEYGPLVLDFAFSRFTQMTDAEKDASLTAWMTSRFHLRRLAFFALRNLCFLGYYSQDETWPLIDYGGPLLQAEPAP
jgi:hypothetical protein